MDRRAVWSAARILKPAVAPTYDLASHEALTRDRSLKNYPDERGRTSYLHASDSAAPDTQHRTDQLFMAVIFLVFGVAILFFLTGCAYGVGTQGKVVAVTGAPSGFGNGGTLGLGEHGGNVVIAGRLTELLQDATERFTGNGDPQSHIESAPDIAGSLCQPTPGGTSVDDAVRVRTREENEQQRH